MSKMLVSFILALAVVSVANGDQISDLLNSGNTMNMNSLHIISILLNPAQYVEQKMAEFLLNRELHLLKEDDGTINLSLDKVNTVDIASVYTINADLTDSESNTQNYNITIAIRPLKGITDVSFNSEGQPTITKQIKW